MSAVRTLTCDAPIAGGCVARVQALSEYTSATELRKLAKSHGWRSVMYQMRRQVIHLDGVERTRQYGERRDFCAAHAVLIPKPAQRVQVLPTFDYRTFNKES